MAHRVNATLPDDVYEVLRKYSALMGTTPSTVLRDFVIEMTPSFSGVIDAVRLAEGNKKKALEEIQSLLLDRVHEAVSLSSEVQREISGL